MADPFTGAPAPLQEQLVAAPAGADGAAAAAAAEAAADAGTAKASRNVKTPLQKEVLEASYQIDPSPSLQHRKALAERIGLTEEQVNSWFNGKRRRDKKKADGTPAPSPAAVAGAAAAASKPADSEQLAAAPPADSGVGAGSGGAAMSAVSAELLEAAKASLPVKFVEDGPPLSFIFDSVPAPSTKKGMQAAALIAAKRKKLAAAAAAAGEAGGAEQDDEQGPAKKQRVGGPEPVDDQLMYQQALQQQAAMHATSTHQQVPTGRVLAKAEREKQREEARRQREMERARAAQEREAKRREAQEERERRAEEKRKAADDRRREKESAKALAQQERAAGRGPRIGRPPMTDAAGGSHHYHGHNVPDDCELEREALLLRARASAAAQAAARGLDASAVEPVVGPPPEFPPPYLQLQPAFLPELGDELGQALIEAWGFTACLADLLGAPPFSMEALLGGLQQGSSSGLLGLLHVLLLRQAQADMEEAHATGVLQSPQIHLCDRTLVAAAQRLEEAWAWGLDPDLWRAHLGPATWPEVLRQHALASGAGGSRYQLKQQPAAAEGPDGAAAAPAKKKRFRGGPAAGYEGEDILPGGAPDGPLKLQLPQRFAEGTWMAAAWRVLAGVGPEGMYVNDLVRVIAERGLRSLAGKHPEASLTGALSREVLFTRLKPGTYALQSIVAYHQRMAAAGQTPVVEPPADVARPDGAAAAAMDVDGHDDEEEEEESDEEEAFAAAPEDAPGCTAWAATLKHSGYDSLSLQQRLEALLWLGGLVGEGPGVRGRLEAREREAAALRKQLLEDGRAEKKRRQEEAARRQEEAAARQRAAAAAAQRHLEELQQQQQQQQPELSPESLKQQQLEAQRAAEAEAAAAVESTRRAVRAEAIRRCEELNCLRLEPLGLDRRYNRYWLLTCPDFAALAGYAGRAGDLEAAAKLLGTPRDANAGRIFVEPAAAGGRWRVLLRTQQLDQLKQVLEPRGLREGQLHQALLRVEASVRAAMPAGPLAMPRPLGQQPPEQQRAAREAAGRWLASQPLLAASLTSSSQQQSIEAALSSAADAAAAAAAAAAAGDADTGDAMQLDLVMKDEEGEVAAADEDAAGADGGGGSSEQQDAFGPVVMQLKRDMLQVEALLADTLKVTTPHFDHQAWVQSVAAASSLSTLRSNLAQLEDALTHEGQGLEKGKKTRGQAKAESERIPLLSPAWHLGPQRAQLTGRECLARYRYIVKPAPLYVPATLEQLLSQERAADKQLALAAKPQQDEQQDAANSPEPQQDSKEQQQQEGQQDQQQQEQPPDQDEQKQQQQQQQQKAEEEQQQQQQQQQLQLWQQEQLSCSRSLQDVLVTPLRVVYGYSLAGRGLLQLLRGLPPYPDWTQQARLEEFSFEVEAFRKAVQSAQEDGTFSMTIPEIRAAKQAAIEAEAAAARAEAEAKLAAKAAAKETATPVQQQPEEEQVDAELMDSSDDD
ncbi:hypothetical protein OEZ85_006559 [Tetradesmus obliquus]|uniref:Homeobox domain-containing protein n=1 Tax=Tetradesmus obliquus TaxID=3088 RepID=A0ABY8TV00_TETOB|nr:hypothetical protein OEZ85_006559 [Tetradesmus obliquus]